MKTKSKTEKTMSEVSKGYEAFIKEKELKSNGPELFTKVIKKAITTKAKRHLQNNLKHFILPVSIH